MVQAHQPVVLKSSGNLITTNPKAIGVTIHATVCPR